MIDISYIVVLAAHLLLMNLAVGLPLVCFLLAWRDRGPTAAAIGRILAWSACVALLCGVLLGGVLVAMLWWGGGGDYFRAVATIPPSRLWFGLAEILFSFLLLGLYALAWQRNRAGLWRYRLLPLLSSTNLGYHFPLLFVAISQIAQRPELWGQVMSRAELRAWMFSPQAIALAAHVLLASLAAAGAALAILASRKLADTNSSSAIAATHPPASVEGAPSHLIGLGAWIALIATALQLPVGLWVLLVVSETARNRLLGDDLPTAMTFGAGILLALWLLHVLLAIALGERTRQKSYLAAILMAGTVVAMTASLHGMSDRF